VKGWLEPQPADAWRWMRIGLAASLLVEWVPRYAHLTDVYSSAGIVLSGGAVRLADSVMFSPTTTLAIWCGLVASAFLLLVGRFTRVAIVVLLVTTWALNLSEGMNFKAYDRLGGWMLIALFASPGGGTYRESGSPAARYFLILVFCGIYGSTGFSKLLVEPDWFTGEPLAYDFVGLDFGGTPLGIWMSDKIWITRPLCWLTLLFECGFPIFIWSRRTNPWILLLGAIFHVGILFTLDVSVFSPVAMSAYPVLLHRDVWPRVRDWILDAIPKRKPRAAAA